MPRGTQTMEFASYGLKPQAAFSWQRVLVTGGFRATIEHGFSYKLGGGGSDSSTERIAGNCFAVVVRQIARRSARCIGTLILGAGHCDDCRCAKRDRAACGKIDNGRETDGREEARRCKTCGCAWRARKVLRIEQRPDYDGSFQRL